MNIAPGYASLPAFQSSINVRVMEVRRAGSDAYPGIFEGVTSMRSILLTLALALFAASAALAQQTSDLGTQAQEILKRARAVIWDETKSKPLQSLSINAIRRF